MNKFFRKAIVLTLAGSALLYTGCTKDYSGDITTLQKEVAELQKTTSESISGLRTQVGKLEQAVAALEKAKQENDEAIKKLQTRVAALETFQDDASKELATLKQNITDLQTVDQALAAALAAANERIEALENNTYTKTEVDGKIESVKEWAMQTFATKATVQLIDNKLGEVSGIVDGILKTLDEVDGELKDIWTALGNVKTTAEQALENANSALTGVSEIKQDLIDHYYTSEKVNALLKTLENNLQAQIDAEIAAREAGDAAAQTRIDSLAKVTKAIEDDLDGYKKAVDKHFEEVENLINEEVQNRMIADALLKQEIADTAAAIRGFVKEIEAALDVRITTNANNIADLQDKYTELRSDLNLLAANVLLLDIYTKYLDAQMKAYAERVQSVVFVPKYTDFAADVYELWLPQGRIQTRVSGTFEVKPASSIDRLEQLVASGEIQVAVRELDSRADYDYLVNDVEVFILDEERGRFEVSAYVGPQVGVLGQDDTPFAISLILGDFTAVTVLPTDEEGTAVDFSAGNSIQSTYVPVAAAKEGARIVPGFVWYDTVKNQPSQLGDSQEPNTELSVALRVPYTKPAEDFSVYTALSEDFDYVSYPEEGKEYPYPAGVELYLDLDGIYMPIATFALAAHVNVADITPTVEAENHTYNPDVDPAEQDELVPFEYAGGIAPATTVTTAAPEGKELKDYVSWYGTHSEEFGFYDKDNNFLPIGVSAFAKTTITKNQVPFFTVDPAYVIPWSYQHPEAVENKVFEITEADGQLYAAVQGVQMNDVENPVNYTRKEGEEYENYPCPNSEDVSFEGNEIFFDKWIFEASDVDYKAGKILFETESDEYDFDVPFVVKKIASDRDVKIDLGEISYTPTNGYSSFINVIKEGFQAHETEQEDYFIGDAVVAVNEGDDEHQVQLDSLYSHFVKEEPFTIEDITVDGVSINGFGGFHINFAYDVESHEDISTFAIDPVVLGYGKTVVVKGIWTAWGVDFNYEITFKTAEVPFLLVLTPYENYNPEKDKTIYVEGDNTNLDVYTLEQMFYNKYLRVVDKKNYESATGADKYHGTTNGSDLEVRFIYKYENETSDEGWAKFGLENMTEAEAILERGSLLAFDVVPVKTGYYGDVVAPGEAIPGTVGPNDEILSWGSYNGRQVNVSAALYEAGQKVSEDVIFDFVTYKPIEMKTTGNITTDPEGNPLIRISGHKLEANVAQNLTIGGILSRDADNGYAPYYIADASVFGYMDNNVRQKDVIDPETGDVLFAAGEVCPFYGLLLEPDWTDVTSIVNLKQYKLVENIDFITNGFKFELISDSAKASSEITVPVKLRYMLDYCGKEAEVVNVTIVIQQI